MDERVYEVDVCPDCLAQRGESDLPDLCPVCGCREPTVRVRFRVACAAVLRQADPHRSLVERTVYFGCVGEPGHYFWARGPEKIRHSRDHVTKVVPWGWDVQRLPQSMVEGDAHVHHHDDGWTAISFEDRSVDTRPGSWSIYCIPAILDGTEALAVAHEAFPTIFARYKFDVRLAT